MSLNEFELEGIEASNSFSSEKLEFKNIGARKMVTRMTETGKNLSQYEKKVPT